MAGASLAHSRRDWRRLSASCSISGRPGRPRSTPGDARPPHAPSRSRSAPSTATPRARSSPISNGRRKRPSRSRSRRKRNRSRPRARSSICRARAKSVGRTRRASPPSTTRGSRRKPSATASSIPTRSSATPARSSRTSETRRRSRPIRRRSRPRPGRWPCACRARIGAARQRGHGAGETSPRNDNRPAATSRCHSDPDGAFAHSGGGAPGRTPRNLAESESGGHPGLYGLVPSEEQIARAVGSGTQDHLADIDEGNETALNAKRWVYATFFNRVKERVRDHWKPAEEYQRRDPTGKIYGAEDRYTLLQVNLKADGSLADGFRRAHLRPRLPRRHRGRRPSKRRSPSSIHRASWSRTGTASSTSDSVSSSRSRAPRA